MGDSNRKHYLDISARGLGVEKQIRKLEQFDELFNKVFQPAVDKATRLSAEHSKELAPKGKTKLLSNSIKTRKVSPTPYEVQGKVVVTDVFGKANALERGRPYTKNGTKYHWKGKWYLAYGPRDNKDYILKLYQISSLYLTDLLSVKSSGE